MRRLFNALRSPGHSDIGIAVVIPLYNHARYIESTLESVLRQNSPADEIIVIDDGSRDDGADIAERMLQSVSGARVLRQDNVGTHLTLNRAIGLATTPYIAILNSDDRFSLTKLKRCRNVLSAHPGTGVISGRVDLIDDDDRPVTSGVPFDWLTRARSFHRETGSLGLSLMNENFVATTSNIVLLKSFWRRVQGFQPLRYCNDLDFLLQAVLHGQMVLDDEAVHMSYRVHARNTIKEDLSGVRLEIGAVLAWALFHADSGALFANPLDSVRNALLFRQMARNKDMSDLLLYLQTQVPRYPDRTSYYADVLSDRGQEALRQIQ